MPPVLWPGKACFRRSSAHIPKKRSRVDAGYVFYFEKVIAFRKQAGWIWYHICGFPPLLELREEMCKYHCYLGIFGDCFLGGVGGGTDLILCLCCEFLSFLPLESFKT